MSEKENRIRAITRMYYSNPTIQKAICEFALHREVIPRYFEGFGKRPDTIQYPNEVMNLVARGATSFHASEELWIDPLQIDSDMSQSEFSELRKSWDLLIDIDSPYLDYSKIAAKLIIAELKNHGVSNYGLKFSGSKGFHIIVPGNAFPEEFDGIQTKTMFPEWPRAISEYLLYKIRPAYNREATKLEINFDALEKRTKLSKEDVLQTICPNCGAHSKKGSIVKYQCNRCDTVMERKNPKITKRVLKCIEDTCPGEFKIVDEKEYFYCENCKTTSHDIRHSSSKKVTYTIRAKSKSLSASFKEEVSGEKMASLDLVLVAPRHLFRMPYSLHEKTALASVVLDETEIDGFSPRDASPLKVSIKNFYPQAKKNEAIRLLESSVLWKRMHTEKEEKQLQKKYAKFEKIDIKNVPESAFPRSIQKLLKGLKEGRKRGLFVLLTFLKCLNFSPNYINTKVREWNKKNDPPLKEGYVKSQIEWHLKQKKQILPPNYKNESFYKDLNLLDATPREKNPIVEVLKKVRRN